MRDMTTTYKAPDYRRQSLRLERGSVTADEFISYLAHPWVDMTPKAPTDAQWREIGKINGMTLR